MKPSDRIFNGQQLMSGFAESSSRLADAWSRMLEEVAKPSRTDGDASRFPIWSLFSAPRPREDPQWMLLPLQEMMTGAAMDLPALLGKRGDADTVGRITDKWRRSYEKTMRRVLGIPEPSDKNRLADQWRSFLRSMPEPGKGSWSGLFPNLFKLAGAQAYAGRGDREPGLFEAWFDTYRNLWAALLEPVSPPASPAWVTRVRRAVESEIEYLDALDELYESVAKASSETVAAVVDAMMASKGSQVDPATYVEFQRAWISHGEKVLVDLFNSHAFHEKLSQALHKASEAETHMEDVLAEGATSLRLPATEEIDRLSQTVTEQSERIESLEREVEALKTVLQRLTEESAD